MTTQISTQLSESLLVSNLNPRIITVLYWTTTGMVFLFEGVLTALTSHTQVAVEGIRHLGYPDYFRVMLMVFKVIGALVLVIPAIKGRYKEWAYAGFGIDFIAATVSHWVVDGFGGQTVFPAVFFGILTVSYLCYHRIMKSATPQ